MNPEVLDLVDAASRSKLQAARGVEALEDILKDSIFAKTAHCVRHCKAIGCNVPCNVDLAAWFCSSKHYFQSYCN